MNILVVNDDGYSTKGIKILTNAFRKIGKVFVVAPHTGQSGASSSITVKTGLIVHSHDENVWSVEGTPSDCVKYALFGLKLDIDLVVSGVNDGFNLGIDTIYSGTIGATMEALLHGKKAIAFSTEYDNFGIVENEIDSVINFIFSNDLLANKYVLNINFPKKGYSESKGIIITDLEIRNFELEFIKNDNMHYSKRSFKPYEDSKKTDIWALKNGYTSITPLKLGNGDETIVELLNEKVNNKR